MKRPLHRILLGLIALLLALIVMSWLLGGGRWDAPEPIRPEIAPLSAHAVSGQADVLTAMIHRPLFSTDRRPAPNVVVDEPSSSPAVAEATAEQGPDALDRATLHGIVGAGDHGVLILNLDGRDRRLPVGESLESWRLMEIRGLEAHFRDDHGAIRTIRISRAVRAATHEGPGQGAARAASTAEMRAPALPAEPAPPQSAVEAPASPAQLRQNHADWVSQRQAQRAAAEREFREWQRANQEGAR